MPGMEANEAKVKSLRLHPWISLVHWFLVVRIVLELQTELPNSNEFTFIFINYLGSRLPNKALQSLS